MKYPRLQPSEGTRELPVLEPDFLRRFVKILGTTSDTTFSEKQYSTVQYSTDRCPDGSTKKESCVCRI